jgi:phosphoribosylaminoimidazole-succinocarboxamide synthase
MYAGKLQNHRVSNSVEPHIVTSYPRIALMRRGKDKDVYDLGDMLLMVATDRLSAGGKNLGKGIKGKGRITNQLSAHWFRKLRKVFPNHLVSADSSCFPEQLKASDKTLNGCSMLVWKTTPLPIRCVVRGYLAGAGWREYQEKGEI